MVTPILSHALCMGALLSFLFGGPPTTHPPTQTAFTEMPTLAVTTGPGITLPAVTSGSPAATTTTAATPTPQAALWSPITLGSPAATTTTAATPTPQAAPWSPINPSWNQLNLSGWGRCLASDLKTYNCDRTPSSFWATDASGLLVNQATGQCMQAGAATQGAPLAPAVCQPSNALQQWTRDGNRIRLKTNPSLVAEVPAYDYTRSLGLWSDNGGGNQTWMNT